jgi:hypothetical protein
MVDLQHTIARIFHRLLLPVRHIRTIVLDNSRLAGIGNGLFDSEGSSLQTVKIRTSDCTKAAIRGTVKSMIHYAAW